MSECKQCAVCKQKLEGLVVETSQGEVHPGPCQQYADEQQLNESTVENTELIL